jgi:hypothetical protein
MSLGRVGRVIEALRGDFDRHAQSCGDEPLAVALNPTDFDELGMAELWGLPVLAWDKVAPGRLKVLCQAEGYLVPQIDSVEDLQELWELHPPKAPPATARV